MPKQPEKKFRVERDSMGEVRVPAGTLYGAQTQRAFENFPPAAYRLQRPFLHALGLIKACAAETNAELGTLSRAKATKIIAAAKKIAQGEYDDQFVVSIFQTGSGTSTNMNANEIIATLTDAHPNDDVNQSQSSNDVIPSAIHIAGALEAKRRLLPCMDALHAALQGKTKEFWKIHKIGRTHLQDATPMRLGEEFSGYAYQVKASKKRMEAAMPGLLELPLGGTAIGTGLNAPKKFAAKTIQRIAKSTGLPFREAPNHFEAQAAKDAILFFSGALRTYAVALTKIANDIRWLGSGPRGGLGEIILPELQPGSSIMPGKVNPVIPESVLMACAQTIGHDAAITWGCSSGNFELNTMMPLIAFNLLDSLDLLSKATENLANRCVHGLKAREDGTLVERSLAVVTALVPEIGYDKAAAIAKEAYKTGRTVREVAREQSGLTKTRIDDLLRLK